MVAKASFWNYLSYWRILLVEDRTTKNVIHLTKGWHMAQGIGESEKAERSSLAHIGEEFNRNWKCEIRDGKSSVQNENVIIMIVEKQHWCKTKQNTNHMRNVKILNIIIGHIHSNLFWFKIIYCTMWNLLKSERHWLKFNLFW